MSGMYTCQSDSYMFLCHVNCALLILLVEIHVELGHLKSKLNSLERGSSGTKSPSAQRLKHAHVVLDSLQKVAKAHTAAFQVSE